ncbi:MAG: SDR family oxidoreductase [Pseudomonadota bacterium]
MNQSVTLITGAASGIGACLAERLAQPGHGLLLHTGSNIDGLDAVCQRVEAKGATVLPVMGDLCEPAPITAIVEAIDSKFQRLDAFVSNAGHANRTPFADVNAATMSQTFESMASAFVQLVQGVLPHLKRSPMPRIVAVSSFINHRYVLGGDAFFASTLAKGALESAVRATAAELAPHDIPVNAVVPGYIRKDAEIGLAANDVNAKRTGAARIAMGRVGEPHEVAGAIAFLLSAEAAYITGQCLHVDGGLML